ncbi:pirin family protein [Anoxybacillus sp. UARK-01]|uniref:pirin family protein n=1 Tax=Anoxybacillus sp. UARK-01 TaxID=1895648 RepID=UPI0009BBE071|nr:pirin-like bicupin family protein [Anoxybacillus sp. UARK-01]OQM46443.1 pirin family protein [Anoxybacillus sp. UARK-01]
MIQIYPADERYHATHGWLDTYFSFSFAEYFDPTNVNFGPLRVLNDDVIKPLRGFGAHPHQEMEIVSIVLSGQLKHKDSLGNEAITTFGGIQRMSAGTGIVHSEVNPSATEDVNLLQLWFLPERRGLAPSYEKTDFDISQLKNQWLPVVAKNPQSPNVAHIHQDLTIYLSDIEAGNEIIFEQEGGRRIFLFVIDGELKVNEEVNLYKRDSARMAQTPQLKIAAETDTRVMLIDLP